MRKYQIQLICLFLVLCNLVVYLQVLNHEFISFDDGSYIYNNSNVTKGLTGKGFFWAFTSTKDAYNWHPLTWLSHMLDCELYGLDAGGHHFTNVLLHTANAVLLFLVLNYMTTNLWPSALAALLFAIHPLHIESVAWASERKDVLSAFFWLLTIFAYIRYTKNKKFFSYFLALFFFALGLMAKQMLVTLPFVLLLLDVWPLRRLGVFREHYGDSSNKSPTVSTGRCILEKVPFLFLTALASITVFIIQRDAGFVKKISDYPILLRVGNAVTAYIIYIIKMLYPVNLAIFYPHSAGFAAWKVIGSAVLLAAATIAAIIQMRSRPYIFVGWFWYVGTLVPVIGLVQIGLQAYADRYTYIPLAGLFIIIAWGLADIGSKLNFRNGLIITASIILLPLLLIMSWRQVSYWKNNEALYTHATEAVARNWWAHHFLGKTFIEQNKPEKAVEQFHKALQIDTKNALVRNDLGDALIKQGKYQAAIDLYEQMLPPLPEDTNELRQQDQSIWQDPKMREILSVYIEARVNLGIALMKKGDPNEAIKHFRDAIRIKPNCYKAHKNIADIFLQQANYEKAMEHYSILLRVKPDFIDEFRQIGYNYLQHDRLKPSIEINKCILKLLPDDPDAHNALGIALGEQGKINEAIFHFKKVLSIRPNSAEAHSNIGYALVKSGKLDEAFGYLKTAVLFMPENAMAHYQLGVILQSKGKIGEAIEAYYSALKNAPDWAALMDTLARLLATTSDEKCRNAKEAIRLSKKVCEMTNYTQPELLDTLALAYAADGNYAKAMETADKAIKIAEKRGSNKLAAEIKKRLELYEKSQLQK